MNILIILMQKMSIMGFGYLKITDAIIDVVDIMNIARIQMDEFFEADSWRDIIKQSFLKDRDKYITGWIAPDGEFFGCAPEDHDDLAEYVFEKTQSELEEAGWLKVYEVHWRLRAMATYREDYGPYSYFGRPTEKQLLTLERLGIEK